MKTILTIALVIFTNFIYGQTSKISVDYFGQTPPDTVPEIFAPELFVLTTDLKPVEHFLRTGNRFILQLQMKILLLKKYFSVNI